MRSWVFLLYAISVVKGSLDERINGGFIATESKDAYVAGIMYKNVLVYAGTIINSRHILTVALFICDQNPKFFTVVVGTNYVTKNSVTYLIEKFICHPAFNETERMNNIGVIRLMQDITFSSGLQPITLSSDDYIPAGEFAVVAFWKKENSDGMQTTTLKKMYMEVISPSKCEEHYGQWVKEKYICTFLIMNETVCHGNGGAPLIFEGAQIGMIAYVQAGCLNDYPVVHTMVSPFIPWIQSVSGPVITTETSGSNVVNPVNTWIVFTLTILALSSYSYSLL